MFKKLFALFTQLDIITPSKGNSALDNKKGKSIMTTYTDSMVAALNAAAPFNLEKAHAFAAEFGVSYRSAISKAKQLGIAYEKKAPAAKKPAADRGITKAAVLVGIRSALALPEREGDLTKAELEAVLAHLG